MKTNASLRLGKILKILALLFLAAAALLTASNLLQAKKAAEKSELVLQELSPALEYKIQESSTQTAETLTLPDYVLNPDMEMPCIEVEGNEYIGVLDIPTLELSLPIMAEWDYEKLKIAPCRYTGSVYKNDLIIVAHNYVRHFGKLSTLSYGDDIYFAYNEAEKNEIIKNLGKSRYTVQRSKGLGENQPDMMWQTTMNPATRRLVKVEPASAEETERIFDTLLGDNLAERKRFITLHGNEYLAEADI